MNVIEHLDNDEDAVKNISKMLSDSGRAIVLVPKGMWLFGSQDEVLGHKRRYSEKMILKIAKAANLKVKTFINFNKISTLPWYVNGKILKKKTFSRFQLFLLDISIPIIKKIEKFLPWPSLSIIAILEKIER